MPRIIKFILITTLITGFICPSMAQQSGSEDSYQDICSLSHGRWVDATLPSWACCWVNWGCYECLNNICHMNCTTSQCKKANKLKVPGASQKQLKALAPAGMPAPIIPGHPKKVKLPLLPELNAKPLLNSR